MQNRLITSLCFITFSLTACDKPQTPETQQHTTTVTPKPLSQNNITDLTADIAALQCLQSLQGIENIDFINDLLNFKKQDNQQKHYAQMHAFIQQYDKELNQLTLTSAEADQFRTQVKRFNQLALQLSTLELQEKTDEKVLLELKNKIRKTQQELSSQYSQIEQKISASGKEIQK